MICFTQYTKLKLSNLTQINAKILVMDLKYILNLISCLREEKNASCKSYFQPK